MRVYSYSEARRRFTSVLNRASREGEVVVRRRDGRCYRISADKASSSGLDVPGVRLGVSTADIVHIIREGRRRS